MKTDKVYRVCGLRSATAEDIKKLTCQWRADGFRVVHVVIDGSGKHLPHNGVLKGAKSV